MGPRWHVRSHFPGPPCNGKAKLRDVAISRQSCVVHSLKIWWIDPSKWNKNFVSRGDVFRLAGAPFEENRLSILPRLEDAPLQILKLFELPIAHVNGFVRSVVDLHLKNISRPLGVRKHHSTYERFPVFKLKPSDRFFG